MPKAAVAEYWDNYPYFNVNPAYGNNNCANCAIALEATLAGRPASALPGNGMGPSIPVFEAQFDKGFFYVNGRADIEKILTRNGDRGVVIGVRGKIAHAFNVVNIDGTIHYINGGDGGDGVSNFLNYNYFKLSRTKPNNRIRIKDDH